jgi:hypothetical protein
MDSALYEDFIRPLGDEYPGAINVGGTRIVLAYETRFKRHYIERKPDVESHTDVSRFIDGTASITLQQLREEWFTWTDAPTKWNWSWISRMGNRVNNPALLDCAGSSGRQIIARPFPMPLLRTLTGFSQARFTTNMPLLRSWHTRVSVVTAPSATRSNQHIWHSCRGPARSAATGYT